MSENRRMSATEPPPPGTRGKPFRRRSGRRGRGLRRPEEDRPGPDYLQRMEHLGPRDGESYYAFRVRMASVRAGRELIIESARRNYGNIADVCRELGINRQNMPAHLKNVGLTSNDLLGFRPEYRQG